MMKICVVGAGYWGPNLIRNFYTLPDVDKIVVCDLSKDRLRKMKSLYPKIETTTDYSAVLDSDVDAVALATNPLSTHFKLGKPALEKGKHLWLEKPMTSSSEEAEELIRLAEDKGVLLHVDHTFEYSSPVTYIKQMIDSGELGQIYSINMSRLNLGLFQKDYNVLWDLCPHDFSMLMYWLGRLPKKLIAQGTAHITKGIEDDGHVLLEFDTNINAHIHVSWLEPQKIRRITIVGSKKMLVYDDVEPTEKVRIYDKGVDVSNVEKTKQKYYDTFEEFVYYYRHGDVSIPKINFVEPLKEECIHFLDCIKNNKKTKTDGESGLRVVRLLEASLESLKNRSKVIILNADK